MAKSIDTVKELEAILIVMKDQLNKLEPGSEEYGRQIRGICELQHELTENKKAIEQAKHEEIKCEQLIRMNDKEIEFKDTQLGIEATRAMNEKEFRKHQLGGNLIVEAVKCFFGAYREVKYEARWQEAMKAEYGMSEGASLFPPSPVTRILTEDTPKRLV